MTRFSNLSISHKLKYIILISCMLALVIAGLFNAYQTTVSYRSAMVAKLYVLADVLGENSKASLTFKNQGSAVSILGALSTEPDIISASLYNNSGELFAEYAGTISSGEARQERGEYQDLLESGALPAKRHFISFLVLDVVTPIVLDEEHIGSIHIQADLSPMYRQVRKDLYVMFAVMLGAILLALLVSTHLQRVIISPIQRLAGIMEKVSKDKDYKLRVENTTEDEIGTLIDGFNVMLGEIQQRDEQLSGYGKELEQRVAERTVALSNAIAELETTVTELKIAKAASEKAAKAKTEFLATMSHELRTPMAGVVGALDLLELGELDNGETQEFYKILRHSADAQLTLISDILDLSKIETGNLELEANPFGLVQVVDDALSVCRPKAEEKGLSLAHHGDVTKSQLFLGDALRLRQVILNLVGNAVKYTEKGGISLVYTVKPLSPPLNRIRVEVRDTGIGVSSSQQDEIFNPFVQADSTTSREYGGTGLGLSICKSLIEAMKGRIGVDSEPGKGSVFWFELELEAVSDNGKQMAAREGEIIWTALPARILVADDNIINCIVIEKMLTQAGHALTIVEDGPSALDALQKNVFDLVLLDIRMPGMDGTEVVTRIREREDDVASIPAIAITADMLKEHVVHYHAAGFDSVVGKPIDWMHLDSLIAAIVGCREIN